MARLALDNRGLRGAPTIPTSSGGAGVGAPGVVTAEQFGAVGDNSTDDTVALQAAINAVKAVSGTVALDPRKTYKITSPLYLGNNTGTYRITSASGVGHFTQGGPTIHLVGNSGGTGVTGGAMQFNDAATGQSAYAVELDHIRFTYDPNSFTGANTFLVNVAPHSGGAGDIQPFHIHHCSFAATSAVNPANGCAAMLRLYQAIIGQIDHCHFGSAQNGIQLSDPGGSYVNVVTIGPSNTFNFMQNAHIEIGSADCESLTIKENTFEDAPANGAIHGNNCSLYSPVIEKNWFGDYSNTFTPGRWINGLNVTSGNFMGLITGNRFSGVTKHLLFTGTWCVFGNTFEGGTIFDISWGNCTLIDIANYYNTPTTMWTPGDPNINNNAQYTQLGSLVVAGTQPPAALVATNLNALGLAGARHQSRWVGATTAGAPITGTFVQGDYVIDWAGAVWVCTVAGSPGTWTAASWGATVAPAYSASITPNARTGSWQTITATNATAFTINAPSSPPASTQTGELTIEVLNSSGGAMGAITWNGAFVFAGFTWTNPASTKKRFARFEWNGTNWVCTGISTADY